MASDTNEPRRGPSDATDYSSTKAPETQPAAEERNGLDPEQAASRRRPWTPARRRHGVRCTTRTMSSESRIARPDFSTRSRPLRDRDSDSGLARDEG